MPLATPNAKPIATPNTTPIASRRVAITGASGFIGSRLAAALLADGHEVVRIGRGPVQPGRVDVSWDPERGVLEATALAGVDAVVHLAGASIAERWTPAHRRAIRTSRVASTALLARTISMLDQRPRVLLSGSAIGIYGSRGDELLTEQSAPGHDELADVCLAWEAATDVAAAAGVRVVHLRTGIVQGASGGALRPQLPLFRLGLGGPLGDGTQYVSPIALDDHVRAMRWCLGNAAVRGAVNLVGPTPVTNAEYTRVLASVLDRPAVLRVPAWALRVALGEAMADATVLASQRVLPTVLQDTGFTWQWPDLPGMLRQALSS